MSASKKRAGNWRGARTAAQKLILAIADAVGDELAVQLTETNMAIICWRRFPTDFGIITASDLPDTKRFSTVLHSGRCGLKRYLRRAARGRYSLTVDGVELAEQLRTEKC